MLVVRSQDKTKLAVDSVSNNVAFAKFSTNEKALKMLDKLEEDLNLVIEYGKID